MPVKVDYELRPAPNRSTRDGHARAVRPRAHGRPRADPALESHRVQWLPRHVRSLDVGGFSKDGALISLGDVEEFFILNDFVAGDGYYQDLERLRDGPTCKTAISLAPTRSATISSAFIRYADPIPRSMCGGSASLSAIMNASWAFSIRIRELRRPGGGSSRHRARVHRLAMASEGLCTPAAPGAR